MTDATSALASTSTWWTRFWQRRASRARAAQGFDLKLLRFPVMITALLSALLPFDFHPAVNIAAIVAFPILGLLVCLYFGHILMRRLQCSLLEFGVLIVVFGNAAGLVLTSSGTIALSWNWLLTICLVLTAWIVYGAVRGMSQARLLGVGVGPGRIVMMLLGWLTTAAPAFLILGLFLLLPDYLDRSFARVIGGGLTRWGLPVVIAGLFGVGAGIVLHLKTKRAARKILREI